MTAPLRDTTIPASVRSNAVPVKTPKIERVMNLLNSSETVRPLCVNSKSEDFTALTGGPKT